jgi:Family of unknown function (DUF6077)
VRLLPSSGSGPSPLWIPLEATVAGFACWTLAYHFVLVTRLPARTAGPLFAALLLLALWPLARRWRRARLRAARPARSAALAALSISTALFASTVQRPDADDFDYFHRVLSQATRPDEPFLITDTTHWVAGPAPAFSTLHLMTSYEMFLGFVAGLAGLDPLAFYQNAPPLAAGALLPIVYVLLYREFRLREMQVAAAALAVVFLVLDGNGHRSFGNVTLVRLWQGKTVLWTLLVPMTFLFCRRFLRRPTQGNLGVLALAVVCGVGLSGSGLFLVPASIGAAALSDLCLRRRGASRIARAVVINAAWAYPAVIALAYGLGALPRPHDVGIWSEGWAEGWRGNLGMVVDSPATLVRDLWILVALPLAVLSRPLGWLVVGYSASLFVLYLNPASGGLWLRAVQPAAFWRFLYLLPLPWCAGLALPGLAKSRRAAAVAVVAALAVGVAFRAHVLRAPVTFKTPFAYRLPGRELAFVRRALPSVQGRRVLAPEAIVTVMGLLDPGVRFEATRAVSTRHTFRNAGQSTEGQRRIAAQAVVSTCNGPALGASGEESLRQSVAAGTDAVVAVDCSAALPVLQEMTVGGKWSWGFAADGYVLALRNRSRGEAPAATTPSQ